MAAKAKQEKQGLAPKESKVERFDNESSICEEEYILETRGLKKRFQGRNGEVDALRGVDIRVRPGQIYGIIGLSGAGKSTLIRCLNLLERPDEGKVFYLSLIHI